MMAENAAALAVAYEWVILSIFIACGATKNVWSVREAEVASWKLMIPRVGLTAAAPTRSLSSASTR